MPQSVIEDTLLERNPLFPQLSEASSPSLIGPRREEFLDRSFPQLIADRVGIDTERSAVATANGPLTFAELNARTNELALHLRSVGVNSESVVAMWIDRSLEMAIGIVGILKSGGAYLPLDPDY